MSQSVITFDGRLRRLMRKHRRMANGVVARMGRDGLVSAYPRRRMPRFPLRGIVILAGAAFFFKAFLFTSLGPAVYDDRVALLQQGSIVEQAGAWVMQADPGTVLMSDIIRSVIY